MSKGGCLTSRKTQLSDSKIRCTQERVTKSGAGCTTQYSALSAQHPATEAADKLQQLQTEATGIYKLHFFMISFFLLYFHFDITYLNKKSFLIIIFPHPATVATE